MSTSFLVLSTADKNAATYIFATGAFVFIFGVAGLGGIEVLRVVTRRMEAVRLARGEQGPGQASAMQEAFEDSRFRYRMRIAWIVVAAIGLVALVALVVNKTLF